MGVVRGARVVVVVVEEQQQCICKPVGREGGGGEVRLPLCIMVAVRRWMVPNGGKISLMNGIYEARNEC